MCFISVFLFSLDEVKRFQRGGMVPCWASILQLAENQPEDITEMLYDKVNELYGSLEVSY